MKILTRRLPLMNRARLHPAWIVAGVGLVALMAAAGFRSAPSMLMIPLEQEFGWSRAGMGFAIGVNILLYGLMAPFAAALMHRFGMRIVTTVALVLISLGMFGSIFAVNELQLVLTWGVLVGLGSGSMALVFVSTIVSTWFVKRQGLVSGILSSGQAAGQLVFLPVISNMILVSGWREATFVVAAVALAAVPFVFVFLWNSPAERGRLPFGAAGANPVRISTAQARAARRAEAAQGPNAARHAIAALRDASKVPSFWALAIGFAICGMSTNGLVGAHFIPAAHDHGMAEPVAAGLLAAVGVFDIIGTILSGWLTDRVNPRILLAIYYAGRGLSLLALPALLTATPEPPLILFIVFYGLDWVATVPPTMALCREIFGQKNATIVFGWVFAAHQVGAAVAAMLAGVVHDETGEYTIAWFSAAALCAIAAAVSLGIRKVPVKVDA